MTHYRWNDSRQLSPGGRTITRRAVVLAVTLASLAACGKKGKLELPPEDDDDEDEPGAEDNPDNPEPKSVEDPDTYGDPMTFPEPGENEDSTE
jgi:predicted small lipoprotein YifL